MDVLLINPKHNGTSEIPPLGLEYLASVLLTNNINVAIIDLDVYHATDVRDYFAHQLRTFHPKLVGVTAMSDSFNSAVDVCGTVKDYRPDILTVMGGIHPTVVPDTIMANCRDVDVIVIGEGELTFLEIAKNFLSHKTLRNVNGIGFRDGDKIIWNNERTLIKDLDSLPLPSHDLVNNDDYKTRSISSSRGCFHHCSFCSIQSMYHHVIRLRGIQSIMEEIEHLITCGAQRIMFTDDNFTFSIKRVKELCSQIIRHRFHEHVVFFAEGRIDDICRTPIMAQILSDAGFRGLYVGAESGSQAVLDYYHKDLKTEDIVRGVSYCVEQNLQPVVNFILYGPRDTITTMKETINLAKKVFEAGADIAFAETLTPYPGTPVKDELEGDGKFREAQGIYFFESYCGLDIERILKLCDAARTLSYLVHKDDLFFTLRKAYYELSYLDELLENRIPAAFEEMYRSYQGESNVPEVIRDSYYSVINLFQ